MRTLKTIIAVAIVAQILSTAAQAATPVYDAQSLTKAVEMIKQMQRQIAELADVNSHLREQIKATGAPTAINLPLLDLPKVARQLTSDLQCLKPDLEALMPSVNFDAIQFDTICQGRNIYSQTLFVDPTDHDYTTMTTSEREIARRRVRERRTNIYNDTVIKSLAGSDTAMATALNLNESAEALSTEADAATDLNGRMAVSNKGLVLLVRGQAQTNIILAQLLKLQASRGAIGLDTDVALPGPEQGGAK